jgi:hypothetical protein
VGRTGYHRWKNTSKPALYNTIKKTCLLIDLVTQDDSNVNTKEAEKLNKCKNLEFEASRMWKLRGKNFPVLIRTL